MGESLNQVISDNNTEILAKIPNDSANQALRAEYERYLSKLGEINGLDQAKISTHLSSILSLDSTLDKYITSRLDGGINFGEGLDILDQISAQIKALEEIGSKIIGEKRKIVDDTRKAQAEEKPAPAPKPTPSLGERTRLDGVSNGRSEVSMISEREEVVFSPVDEIVEMTDDRSIGSIGKDLGGKLAKYRQNIDTAYKEGDFMFREGVVNNIRWIGEKLDLGYGDQELLSPADLEKLAEWGTRYSKRTMEEYYAGINREIDEADTTIDIGVSEERIYIECKDEKTKLLVLEEMLDNLNTPDYNLGSITDLWPHRLAANPDLLKWLLLEPAGEVGIGDVTAEDVVELFVSKLLGDYDNINIPSLGEAFDGANIKVSEFAFEGLVGLPAVLAFIFLGWFRRGVIYGTVPPIILVPLWRRFRGRTSAPVVPPAPTPAGSGTPPSAPPEGSEKPRARRRRISEELQERIDRHNTHEFRDLATVEGITEAEIKGVTDRLTTIKTSVDRLDVESKDFSKKLDALILEAEMVYGEKKRGKWARLRKKPRVPADSVGYRELLEKAQAKVETGRVRVNIFGIDGEFPEKLSSDIERLSRMGEELRDMELAQQKLIEKEALEVEKRGYNLATTPAEKQASVQARMGEIDRLISVFSGEAVRLGAEVGETKAGIQTRINGLKTEITTLGSTLWHGNGITDYTRRGLQDWGQRFKDTFKRVARK